MKNPHLEQLLVTLDVAVDAIAVCEIQRGVRLVYRPVNAIEVHYVLEGTLHLNVSGAPQVICGPGSVAIVPPGVAQSVAAERNPGRDVIAREHCSTAGDGLRLYDAADGKSGDLRLICGIITASPGGCFDFLHRLIEPIVEDLSGSPVVRQAFTTMLEEVARPRLGTRALTSALMNICLLKALQSHFDGPSDQKNSLTCLGGPRLQKAIATVQEKPEAAYNVAALAELAGMSRAAFASEFLKTFAITPMKFVTKTRLQHAADLLRSTTVSVKVIAASIGFSSRSHFSRAFRDAYGIDPRNFRRNGVTAGLGAMTPPG